MNQISLPIGGVESNEPIQQWPRTLRGKFIFTERCAEIFDDVCAGLSNKEIAAKRFITEKGVKYHVSKILKTTGSKSRKELRAKLGLLFP